MQIASKRSQGCKKIADLEKKVNKKQLNIILVEQ